MMETYLSRSGAVNSGAMNSGAMNSGAMNPAGAHPAAFEAWQALVAPGDVFRHPREVLAHPGLSPGDKRAILASWASDASALEHAPNLRCLVGSRAEPVSVDAVLAALGELDRMSRRSTDARPTRPFPRRLRRLVELHRSVRPGRRDDDDDPPPCPAAAMPRPKTPPSDARAAVIPA